MEAKELPKDVAECYILVPGSPIQFVMPGYGFVDIRTLTLNEAHSLFDRGCEHLALREVKAESLKQKVDIVEVKTESKTSVLAADDEQKDIEVQ